MWPFELSTGLCEVIGGEAGQQLAHDFAKKIAKTHPTLNMLKSSLRKRGLLE